MSFGTIWVDVSYVSQANRVAATIDVIQLSFDFSQDYCAKKLARQRELDARYTK